MARKLFVDTSGWYALIDRRDVWHDSATEHVARALSGGQRVVTSDYVIDESCTLLKARAGSHAALRLLDLLKATQAVDWEWIGAERFATCEAFFRKNRDQGYSFTDCTSFIVMREHRLERALTSDAHFRAAGFTPLLD
jgi:predicted nucleic acid-binding protein